MFTCRALIEACQLVEEGVCSVRDIDVGMMTGAGLDPRKGLLPPFWKADVEGLGTILERMEEPGGEIRRPLRAAPAPQAPGRTGPSRPRHRPGLLPLPAARRGRPGRHGQARDPRRRRHRLARQRADERDLPRRGPRPRHGLGEGQGQRRDRRDGDRIERPDRLLGRRRHQGLHSDGRGGRRGPAPRRPRPAARVRPIAGGDDRRRQRARLRRRLRAGDVLRRADRRRGRRLRPARDQPRDHPRLRRHPAPAAARSARTRRWR